MWANVISKVKAYINNTGISNSYSQPSYNARPKWANVSDYLKKIIDFAALKLRLGC